MQTEAVTKDLMFKLRLDDHDKKRLDALAEHYSAPAATVVRILIKEKFDAVQELKASTTLELTPLHETMLMLLRDGSAHTPDDLARHPGWNAAWRGFNRVLNELRREGYVTKHDGKYTQTAKAAALGALSRR